MVLSWQGEGAGRIIKNAVDVPEVCCSIHSLSYLLQQRHIPCGSTSFVPSSYPSILLTNMNGGGWIQGLEKSNTSGNSQRITRHQRKTAQPSLPGNPCTKSMNGES